MKIIQFITVFIVQIMTVSPQSKAAIGVATAFQGASTGSLVLALAGISSSGLGSLALVGLKKDWIHASLGGELMIGVGGVFLVLAGAILLDQETQELQLSELSQETVFTYSLTANEVSSYHSELPMMNAMLQEAQSTKNSSLEQTAVFQEKFSEYVSPDTRSALKKLIKLPSQEFVL